LGQRGRAPLNFGVRLHQSGTPVTAPLKRISVAAAIGFCVPIIWGMAGLVSFNARQSKWTDLFWYSVYLTCPPWLLPESGLSWIVTPALNAVLYGALTWLFLVLGQRGAD